MTIARITKRTVDQLQPGSVIWDSDPRGFGVRRQRRDIKYVLKYRFKGRARFYTIGLHGSPWTPDTARDEARRLLGMIHSNELPRDPAAQRDRAREEPTLATFIAKYLDEYAPGHKKPRTIAEDKRNLEKHVIPVLGKIRVGDVTHQDIARFHHSRREYPVNANRCVTTLGHVFSIAEKWGYRAANTNPCRGIDRFEEKARERRLNADELARLGDALVRAERGLTEAELEQLPKGDRSKRETPEDYRALACFRLLMFTGARLSEIVTLQWDWIKFDRKIAELPDSKTGAKVLALPAPALAIIEQLPKLKGNPHVLPGDRKGSHFSGIQKPWQRVRNLAKLPDLRLHDLRHAFASIAVDGGHSLYLIGKLLGHHQASTTERYAHPAPDPVMAVAERTARQIEGMLAGKRAQVVQLSDASLPGEAA